MRSIRELVRATAGLAGTSILAIATALAVGQGSGGASVAQDGPAFASGKPLQPIWRRDDLALEFPRLSDAGLVVGRDKKGVLVTLDTKTGGTLPRIPTPRGSRVGVTTVGAHVIVTAGGNFHSFDGRTGHPEWKRAVRLRPTLILDAGDGVLIANGVRGPDHDHLADFIVALDVTAGGKELWRVTASKRLGHDSLGVPISVDKNHVAVVNETRAAARDPVHHMKTIERVELVALRTGKPGVTIEVQPNVVGLALDGDRLLVDAIPNSVFAEDIVAYDMRTGSELWRRRLPGGTESAVIRSGAANAPIIGAGLVWVREGDVVLGLDSATGRERSRAKLPKGVRVVRGWATSDGLILAADASFGSVVPMQVLRVGSDGKIMELRFGVEGTILDVAGKVLLMASSWTSRFTPLMAFEL